MAFWIPGGLAMAVLLLSRTRDWPWLLLASFVASFVFSRVRGTPFPVMLAFYCANVVEQVTGAWLVRTLVAERPELKTLKEFTGLTVFAALGNTTLGGVIAATTLVLTGTSHSFGFAWRLWWGSHVMAILIVTPFILTWFSPSRGWRQMFNAPRKIAEALLLLAGLGFSLSYSPFGEMGALSPERIIMIPFLLWAGLRFGTRGATASCLIIALTLSFSLAHSISRVAPVASAARYIFVLQTDLGMATLISLIPAIVMAERDRTMDQLRESEEHYRNLTEAAFEGVAISENGRLVDVNDEILKMFGYKREEMIGRKIVDLVAPEARDVVAERIRTQSGDILEHRLVRKDGSFIFVEARAKTAQVGNRLVRMTALRDITVRKKIEQEREEAVAREQKARAQYTLQLIASQEAERERIAGELHDSLGQNLSVIKNQAQRLLLWDEMPLELRAPLEAISVSTSVAIAEMRRISQDLHPYHLDHLGLTGALDALVESAAGASRIAFRKRFEPVDDVFSREAASSLYRIVQEAINNILKYSGAQNSAVTLERDLREALLVIEDDGQGFDIDQAREGMGLKNMAERARILGGRLKLDSSVGRGVRIELAIPISPKEEPNNDGSWNPGL